MLTGTCNCREITGWASSKHKEEGRQDVRSVAKLRQSWVCIIVSCGLVEPWVKKDLSQGWTDPVPLGKIVEVSLAEGQAAERKLVVEILSAEGSVEPEGMSFSNLHKDASYWVFLLSTSMPGESGGRAADIGRWRNRGYQGTRVDEDTV